MTITTNEVLQKLQASGIDSIKKTLMRHGVKEPLYGVKTEELKKIQKTIKKDHALSLALYDTGIYDAMYLAGLIGDSEKMSREEIQKWARKANAPILREYTVAWMASESKYSMELALEWIESPGEGMASSGWATLSDLVSVKDDAELDIPMLKQLLDRVVEKIHSSTGREKYTMNGFVIAAGTYVKALNEVAKHAAQKIGSLTVDMGGTACKVPSALEYIAKVESKGGIGKKKKTARC